MKKFFIPLFFVLFGTYFTFQNFWHGWDAIPGDLGDSRFNMVVLEHTWHWLKGEHASLFNMPMFFPHPNVYAYSDYLMGFAPIYWLFRSITQEMHLAFQGWLVVSALLNFFSYFVLSKRFFKLNAFWAAFAAYVFSFAVPRTTHLYHVQTFPQFFIVWSAMGLLLWREKPESKLAPWLFFTGGMLQFISAFYWLWFWVLILFFYGVWLLKAPDRRSNLFSTIQKMNRTHLTGAFLFNVIFALPFLYHYLLNAMEIGRHGWVSISETVPRFYSWFYISKDHWQWALTPFKGLISELPYSWEHTLSLGLFTWVGCILAMVWIWKKKPDFRFILIPMIPVFFLTLTKGRFSTWVLVTYLFPGGGAIRAVGRIQIFLLLFWAMALTLFLAHWFQSKQPLKKWMAVLLVVGCLSETVYEHRSIYSRKHSMDRIQYSVDQIRSDCNLTLNPSAIPLGREAVRLDTVLASFEKGIPSMNGYSGHDPRNHSETASHLSTLVPNRSICILKSFNEGI